MPSVAGAGAAMYVGARPGIKLTPVIPNSPSKYSPAKMSTTQNLPK
jgi:hypothetical protein